MMKTLLRRVALTLLLAGAVFWLATGASRGWTKTSVPVKTLDEVTGLEGVTYQRRFVPGLDFLGGVVAGAAVLGGASLIFRKKTNAE
jgi:hypothetical protein